MLEGANSGSESDDSDQVLSAEDIESGVGGEVDDVTAATATSTSLPTAVADNDSDGDEMDEAETAKRFQAARARAGTGRLSQQKGQSDETSSLTFFSLDGESEEEQSHTRAFILADGEVDRDFVQRFEKASDSIRRMSSTAISFDDAMKLPSASPSRSANTEGKAPEVQLPSDEQAQLLSAPTPAPATPL